MSETRNNSKTKILLIVIFSVLLIAIVAVCVGIGISKNAVEQPSQSNTAPYEDVLEENFDIETPYVTLNYPIKWKDKVEINHINEDIYTVEFYKTTDNELIHLFDIAFGGSEGDFIGTLTTESESVELRVVSYSIDNTLSDAELEEIGDMLEDVNQLILALNENKNFRGL